MKLRHLSPVANNQARKVIDNHIALVLFCFLHFYRPFNFFKLFGAHLVKPLRVDLVKFLSEIFFPSFLFSVILVLSCLPFLPMYTFSCWFHGICTPLQPFFAYQLCPSGELKLV